MKNIATWFLFLLVLCGSAWADSATSTAINAQSGELWAISRLWSSARDTTAAATTASQYEVGRSFSTPLYTECRSYLHFAIPSMKAALSCTLYVNGSVDQSDTDFGIQLYGARLYKPTFTVNDWVNFSNHGGAATPWDSTKVLNLTWRSESYDYGWNKIIFNTTGLDSITAAKGDTLWIVMLSNEEVAYNHAQIGQERVSFEYGTNTPYLSMTFSKPTINSPTNFQMFPIAGRMDSLALSWTNNNSVSIDSLVLYQWPDSVRIATLTKTASSAHIGGLNPFAKYRYYVRADSQTIYGYSNADSCWTTRSYKTEDFYLSNTGYAQNAATAVYDSARAETKSDSLSYGSGFLGQMKSGGLYYIFRNYFNVLFPAMLNAKAETLYITGTADHSDADFTISARSGLWNSGTPAKSKYFTFDGWQSGMTPYTGNDLVTPLSTSGFQTGATPNKLGFTQAGRDTSMKRWAAGDSLRFLLFDNTVTAPTGNQYVTISPSQSFIRLTYAPPDTVPGSFTMTAISTDSMLVTWTDRDYTELCYALIRSDGVTELTATVNLIGGTPTADGYDGAQTPTLAWNTNADYWGYTASYPHYLVYDNGAGTTKRITHYRLRSLTQNAFMPKTWTFDASNDSTAWITLDIMTSHVFTANETLDRHFPNANAYRYYRLNMTAGNTSTQVRIPILTASYAPVFPAGTTTVRVGGTSHTITPNVEYSWKLKVVGGSLDGQFSAADSAYSRAAIPGQDTLSNPADSLLVFKLAQNSNPTYTEYAVQDSISGLFVHLFGAGVPDSLKAGAEWHTYAGWGGAAGDTVAVGVGKKYNWRTRARSGQ